MDERAAEPRGSFLLTASDTAALASADVHYSLLSSQLEWFKQIVESSWLAKIDVMIWKDVIPQLFAHLGHSDVFVRQTALQILTNVGELAPQTVCYTAVVNTSPKLLGSILRSIDAFDKLMNFANHGSTPGIANISAGSRHFFHIMTSKNEIVFAHKSVSSEKLIANNYANMSGLWNAISDSANLEVGQMLCYWTSSIYPGNKIVPHGVNGTNGYQNKAKYTNLRATLISAHVEMAHIASKTGNNYLSQSHLHKYSELHGRFIASAPADSPHTSTGLSWPNTPFNPGCVVPAVSNFLNLESGENVIATDAENSNSSTTSERKYYLRVEANFRDVNDRFMLIDDDLTQVLEELSQKTFVNDGIQYLAAFVFGPQSLRIIARREERHLKVDHEYAYYPLVEGQDEFIEKCITSAEYPINVTISNNGRKPYKISISEMTT